MEYITTERELSLATKTIEKYLKQESKLFGSPLLGLDIETYSLTKLPDYELYYETEDLEEN